MRALHRLIIPALVLALAISVALPLGRAELSSSYHLHLPEFGQTTFTTNPRFGLIVAGDPTDALTKLGASWWFSWGQPVPGGPDQRVGQISLRSGGQIRRVPLATLQNGAQQSPGGYWLIGNEPNVPGQDNLSPDEYAVELEYYVDAIKGADPTALIVGPNVLDFDFTCSGCQGLTAGRDWLDGFRSAWAERYGGEPPIDVWGVHAYLITWDKLPMTDDATVQQQIAAFADYLDAIPGQREKPVWLTEFGVIWAFPDYAIVEDGCAEAPYCVAPVGDYDDAGVRTFLDQTLTWLEENADRYRLGKWFLYTTHGQPEPYATAYGGISLLDGPGGDSPLTDLGQIYREHATR